MITFIDDIVPILISFVLIVGLIVFWHHFMKRLVPADGPADAPAWKPPKFKDEPPLHRALTWMCGILFVGLIVEGAATFAYILLVHGLMQGAPLQ